MQKYIFKGVRYSFLIFAALLILTVIVTAMRRVKDVGQSSLAARTGTSIKHGNILKKIITALKK